MAMNKEKIVSRRRNRVFVKEFAKIVSERAAKGATFQLPGGNITPGLKRQLEKLVGQDAGQDAIPSIEGDVPESGSRKRQRSSQIGESETDSEAEIKSESDDEVGIRPSGEQRKDDESDESGESRGRERRSANCIHDDQGLEDGQEDPGRVEVSQEPSVNQLTSAKASPVCQLCGKEYRYKKPHLIKYHPAKFNRIDPTRKMPRREFNLKMDAMLMGIDLTKDGDGTFEEGEDENWIRPEHRIVHKPLLPRASLAPTSMPLTSLLPQLAPAPSLATHPSPMTKGISTGLNRQSSNTPTPSSVFSARSPFMSGSPVNAQSHESWPNSNAAMAPSNPTSRRLMNPNELDQSKQKRNSFPSTITFAPTITPDIMAHYPGVATQEYPHVTPPQMAPYPAYTPLSVTSQENGAVGKLAPNAKIMPRPQRLGPMSRTWNPKGDGLSPDAQFTSSSSPQPLPNPDSVLIPQTPNPSISKNVTVKTKTSKLGNAQKKNGESRKETAPPKIPSKESQEAIPDSLRRLYEDPFAQADAMG